MSAQPGQMEMQLKSLETAVAEHGALAHLPAMLATPPVLLLVLWCAKPGRQHGLWMGEVPAARIQLALVLPTVPPVGL